MIPAFNKKQVATPAGIGALTGLLGLQQKTTQDIANNLMGASDAAGAYAQDKRTEDVTNLLGNVDLSNMSEQEARNRILSTAGGSINPAVQANVDSLLGNIRSETEAKATTDAADLLNARKVEASKADALSKLGLEGIKNKNALKLQQQKTQDDINLAGLKKQAGNKDVISVQNGVKYFRDGSSAVMTDKELESVTKLTKAKASEKKGKESTIAKAAAEAIGTSAPGEFAKTVSDEFEEYISDKQDAFWDRELDKTAKAYVKQAITEMVKTPAGLEEYKVNGMDGVWNKIKAQMDKGGVTFEDKFVPWGEGNIIPNFINPFTTSFQKTIKTK